MIEAAKARYKERHKEEIKLLLKSGVTAEEIDNSIQSLYDSGELLVEDIVYRLKQIRPEITYSWTIKGYLNYLQVYIVIIADTMLQLKNGLYLTARYGKQIQEL